MRTCDGISCAKTDRAACLFISAFFCLIILSGCGSRYATRQIDPSDAFRSYTSSVLTSGDLRLGTVQKLRLLFLDRQFEQSPDAVIEKLAVMHAKGEEPGLIPVISELAYLEAKKAEGNDLGRAGAYYVMAASYAYEYLFLRSAGDSQSLVSPVALFMAELYNSSVSRVVMVWQKAGIPWTDRFEADLSYAHYSLSAAAGGDNIWNPSYFGRFQPAYEIYIEGLKNIYRSHGLGASMIGIRDNRPDLQGHEDYFPPEVVLPVTAALEFPDAESPATSDKKAVLRFYDPLETKSLKLGQRPVPLDTDYSATFGLLMTKIDPSQFELKGLLYPGEYMKSAGIYMLEPYNPEKIPVLMIHGLYSSPSTFIEMFNDLRGVAEIRRRYQFWFFFYPTGLPIIESAALLRKELKEFRGLFDPEGTSPAFGNMVVVGHSMGGILGRMLTQSGGNALWDAHFDRQIDKMDFAPSDMERAQAAFYFEPLPFVRRAVFIAAPHRGSGMAKPWVFRLASRLITMPTDIFLNSASVVGSNHKKRQTAGDASEVTATSISQLNPESPFIKASYSLPLSSNVTYHSIIAVRDAASGPGSSDGIVPYESSHMAEAASEKLVPDSHSCVEHPLTIAEVKRILLEHLKAAGADPVRQPAP